MTEKEALTIIAQWEHSERRFYLCAVIGLICLVLAIFHIAYWAILAVFFAFGAGANGGVLLSLKPSIEYLANGGTLKE